MGADLSSASRGRGRRWAAGKRAKKDTKRHGSRHKESETNMSREEYSERDKDMYHMREQSKHEKGKQRERERESLTQGLNKGRERESKKAWRATLMDIGTEQPAKYIETSHESLTGRKTDRRYESQILQPAAARSTNREATTDTDKETDRSADRQTDTENNRHEDNWQDKWKQCIDMGRGEFERYFDESWFSFRAAVGWARLGCPTPLGILRGGANKGHRSPKRPKSVRSRRRAPHR